MRTQQQWRDLIAGTTRGLTAAQLDAAAAHAYRDEQNGIPRVCAWHSASFACGTLDRCNCMPCVESRRIAA